MLMILSVVLVLLLSCMFAFIKYNSKRSKRYFNEQQAGRGRTERFCGRDGERTEEAEEKFSIMKLLILKPL